MPGVPIHGDATTVREEGADEAVPFERRLGGCSQHRSSDPGVCSHPRRCDGCLTGRAQILLVMRCSLQLAAGSKGTASGCSRYKLDSRLRGNDELRGNGEDMKVDGKHYRS